MKNKLILLFVFGFMLMIPNAKADTYVGTYKMPDFDSAGHSLQNVNGYFTKDIGLGYENVFFSYAKPSKVLNADYFTLQLNLLGVAEPLIGSDTNEWDNCVSFVGKDGSMELQGVCEPKYFNETYSYTQDVEFSINVISIFDGELWNSCEVLSSFGNSATFKCPIIDKTKAFRGIQIKTDSVGGASGYYHAKVSFMNQIYLYNYNSNSDISGAINNQTEQQHKDAQEALKKQEELNNAVTSESDDTESSSCGLICKLKGIFTGIIELPGKLISLLIDALKSLFVPTNNQLYEIINDSKSLSENFGFVGESVNFFINIFTSLLGMVNGGGCIELPEFSVGGTSLFDKVTFWSAQQVCLSDNVILSTHIDTIRTVTSIVLVCLFIGFASSKFFNILSKNDSGVTTTTDLNSNQTTYTEWQVVNGNRTSRSVKY